LSILVIENDDDLCEILGYVLRRAGFEVMTARDGLAGLRLWRTESPSLVLLDIDVPHIDGWEVCRRIRAQALTPIVMLTGLREDAGAVRALNLGADDYVTKPFSPEQLVARIEAVLRRAYQPDADARARRTRVGDLELDIGSHAVRIHGREVRLTALEFRLLRALALHDGQVVPRRELIQKVWGHQHAPNGSVLRGHIWSLRRKVEPDSSSPRYLHTVPRVGYRLTAQAAGPLDAAGPAA
jgi:DNA-binding response OmpR family regulator